MSNSDQSSNSPIGSPSKASDSNTHVGELRKDGSLDDVASQNDDGYEASSELDSIFAVGSKNHKSKSPKVRSLGEGCDDVADENDDGFRTPTEQLIPAAIECPPAPRKPSSRKRKSPPAPEIHRSLFPVDLSEDEVESLFPPKGKRARGDDDVA